MTVSTDEIQQGRNIGQEIRRIFELSDHMGAIQFAVVMNTVFKYSEDQIFSLVKMELPGAQRGQWEELIGRGAKAVLQSDEGKIKIAQLRDSIYNRYTQEWEKRHKQ